MKKYESPKFEVIMLNVGVVTTDGGISGIDPGFGGGGGGGGTDIPFPFDPKLPGDFSANAEWTWDADEE